MSSLTQKEARALWVDALRSGDYLQGRRSLHYKGHEETFCCLGVACKLAADNGVVSADDAYSDVVYAGCTVAMPPVVRNWLGLSGNLGGYRVDGKFGFDSLAAQNDSGVSFATIAGIIESAPAGLFVKEDV